MWLGPPPLGSHVVKTYLGDVSVRTRGAAKHAAISSLRRAAVKFPKTTPPNSRIFLKRVRNVYMHRIRFLHTATAGLALYNCLSSRILREDNMHKIVSVFPYTHARICLPMCCRLDVCAFKLQYGLQ